MDPGFFLGRLRPWTEVPPDVTQMCLWLNPYNNQFWKSSKLQDLLVEQSKGVLSVSLDLK